MPPTIASRRRSIGERSRLPRACHAGDARTAAALASPTAMAENLMSRNGIAEIFGGLRRKQSGARGDRKQESRGGDRHRYVSDRAQRHTPPHTQEPKIDDDRRAEKGGDAEHVKQVDDGIRPEAGRPHELAESRPLEPEKRVAQVLFVAEPPQAPAPARHRSPTHVSVIFDPGTRCRPCRCTSRARSSLRNALDRDDDARAR